jgi:threonylcarbamoyladenosine tRNA methylthiotransferase MtaB
MRVFLTALGCKLNQSEVESWARRLAAAGCHIVGDSESADLCILNTCTVTHEAARKSRQMARRLSRSSQAPVVVTGCYAEINPVEAARLPGVSTVLGMADKERLPETILERLGLEALSEVTHKGTAYAGSAAQGQPLLHTRAFVKIQDGCDNACTYCIVRIARGRQRSRPVQAIVDEVLARQHEGYQEVVLTGVHIGAFGRERGETFVDLVQKILAHTQFPRLRLSSIEPWDLSPDLLQLWQNPRLCRHLHLPLQSGCDVTLQRMNRHYTAAQFSELVHLARTEIPDLAVTTDVIVGFPGEDGEEFAASAAFVASMRFARTHIFPFSARPGTAAASMPDQVTPLVRKRRARQLAEIAQRSSEAFHHHFLGRTMDVLWESSKDHEWSGLTDNYIRVVTNSSQALHNRILPTRLHDLTSRGMRGELAGEARSSRSTAAS